MNTESITPYAGTCFQEQMHSSIHVTVAHHKRVSPVWSIYSSTCETCFSVNRNHTKKHTSGDQNTNETGCVLDHMQLELENRQDNEKVSFERHFCRSF